MKWLIDINNIGMTQKPGETGQHLTLSCRACVSEHSGSMERLGETGYSLLILPKQTTIVSLGQTSINSLSSSETHKTINEESTVVITDSEETKKNCMISGKKNS